MADTSPPTTTQTMVTTLGATAAKAILMTVGAALASHGILGGSGVETFVSIGMIVVGAGWSFWNSYGKVILISKLEVWKAKALAQADALHRANVPSPTDAQIADKIPDPKVTAQVVAKVTAACLALIFTAMLIASPAFAQPDNTGRAGGGIIGKKLTGNPVADIRAAVTGEPAQGSGGLNSILTAFDDKLLPDLQFALNIATRSGNKVTAACWGAWIERINARKTANIGDDGQPLAPPEPHVITDFQKIMDLRNSLQPDSPFMLACQPIASIVKRDIVNLIGVVISGGAGLAGLVPGL